MAFSPDGLTLASASDDGNVKIWDLAMGICLTTLRGFGSRVSSVAFSPDGRTLASGSMVDAVTIWDVMTGDHLAMFGDSALTIEDPNVSVAFSPDNRRVASASQKGVKIWDAATGNCLKILNPGCNFGF